MAAITPYSPKLAGREPIGAMRDSRARLAAIAAAWAPREFERRIAPGKWSVREILVHLAQTELALGNRARLALTVPDFVTPLFDQDKWMALETGLGAADAIAVCLALMAMNTECFAGLSAAQRATTFAHPEYGPISVDWIIYQMAGHHVHHLEQIEGLR